MVLDLVKPLSHVTFESAFAENVRQQEMRFTLNISIFMVLHLAPSWEARVQVNNTPIRITLTYYKRQVSLP